MPAKKLSIFSYFLGCRPHLNQKIQNVSLQENTTPIGRQGHPT